MDCNNARPLPFWSWTVTNATTLNDPFHSTGSQRSSRLPKVVDLDTFIILLPESPQSHASWATNLASKKPRHMLRRFYNAQSNKRAAVMISSDGPHFLSRRIQRSACSTPAHAAHSSIKSRRPRDSVLLLTHVFVQIFVSIQSFDSDDDSFAPN